MSSMSPSHTNWQVVRFEFGSRDMEKERSVQRAAGRPQRRFIQWQIKQVTSYPSLLLVLCLACLDQMNSTIYMQLEKEKVNKQRSNANKKKGVCKGKMTGRNTDETEISVREEGDLVPNLMRWAVGAPGSLTVIPDEVGHQNGRIGLEPAIAMGMRPDRLNEKRDRRGGSGVVKTCIGCSVFG